jgi:hypothetical protein
VHGESVAGPLHFVERFSDDFAKNRRGRMSSSVVTPNPGKLGVLRGVKRRGLTRGERAKEFDLHRRNAATVGPRIFERSGVEGSPDGGSISRLFAHFPHERGAKVLSLFNVPAGNVPRSGERGEPLGPSQEKHPTFSKERGTDADFGA